MKAIIIQDSDASNLLDLLKLETFSDPQMLANIDVWEAIPKNQQQFILNSIHRKFHYIVCRWLQEQGASCAR